MSASRARWFPLVVLLILLAFPLWKAGAEEAGVTLSSSVTCPSSGCAAGQRLNYKFDFSLSLVDPAKAPNVQVCIFTPNNWSVNAADFSSTLQGVTSGKAYTYNTSQCSEVPPANYHLSGGWVASLTAAPYTDAVNFGFRLGSSASEAGYVQASVYYKNSSDAWVRLGQSTYSNSITAQSNNVYVANDPATCGANAPCYVNSLDDLAGGVGTGLKDAVDAVISPGTINLLGTVYIKQNTVLVDKPHTIKGNGTERITYSGTACANPMLKLSAGARITNLAIDDGSCSSPNRDLIEVNSSTQVTIDSNDLTQGKTAVRASAGNTGGLVLRYNHINANSEYAVYLEAANAGVLDAVANNLYGNRAGAQVECNGSAKGIVNHNYWGSGGQISTAASQCQFTDSRRLGAPIQQNTAGPGVQAQQVTVGTTAQYAFNDTIGYSRTSDGSNYDLFIVNHGSGNNSNIPFTSSQSGSLIPCSNYWDIFLASTSAPSAGALNLLFKYNSNPSCISAIESAQYCGQADKTLYPVWWYDLSAANWSTTGTGSSGATTSCNAASDEIQVVVDGAHKPGFNDLLRVPMVVGLPSQPASATFTAFTAAAGSSQATLNWTTSNESNFWEYHVQRSTQSTTGFANVGTAIARKGSAGGGSSYTYTDTGLTNNQTYYYKLRYLGYDGVWRESGVVSVVPIPPTPTITSTPTNTDVPSTATRTLTRYPTSTFIYRTPTPTRTSTPTPTSPFQTITNTPTPTPTSRTRTVTATGPAQTAYPVATTVEASTALAGTRAARTEDSVIVITLSLPAEEPPSETNLLTIAMAALAMAAVIGGAVYLILEQKSNR